MLYNFYNFASSLADEFKDDTGWSVSNEGTCTSVVGGIIHIFELTTRINASIPSATFLHSTSDRFKAYNHIKNSFKDSMG